MSRANDLGFVRHVVARLESAGIRTWLFGGWASELLGLTLPRYAWAGRQTGGGP